MSLTEGIDLKPKKMVYEIVTVDGNVAQSLAFGRDPKDKSEIIVFVQPTIVYGQKFNFLMRDIDMFTRLPACFRYSFSQAGGHILGYAWLHAAKQGKEEENPCGGADLIAVGIVTGERISIGEE